jgi:hypothetical protein
MKPHLMNTNERPALEDKLLDIGEAADFLHVSKMILRRF